MEKSDDDDSNYIPCKKFWPCDHSVTLSKTRSITISGNQRLRPLFLLLCVSAFLIGCKQDQNELASSPNEDPSSSTDSTPLTQELSRIPGVSIVRVNYDRYASQSISANNERWRSASAKNAPLDKLIRKWSDFEGIISIDADIPTKWVYNVEIEATEGQTVASKVQHAFEETFGLSYREGVEKHTVWVLELKETKKPKIKEVDGNGGSSWGTADISGGLGYDFRAGSMDDLAEVLGKYLEGGIVINETGLEGSYNFQLAMNHWEPETAIPAVEALGMIIRKEARNFPTLRVDFVKSQGNRGD